MHITATLGLLIASLAFNGLLTGATLDQAIKQLPARHAIGAAAYSDYSRAADLGNGLIWYPVLGVGTAILTVVTGAVGLSAGTSGSRTTALVAIIVGSVAHMISTAFAAPTNLSQRRSIGDAAALERIFNRFAKLNAARAALMVLTLGAVVWAVIATIQHGAA